MMAAKQLLADFLKNSGPAGFRHFYNAHFPGLWSIVLDAKGECLTRLFVAEEGKLHPDLQTLAGKFLWHAHGYGFAETTLAGHVANVCIRPGTDHLFFRYRIEAGIDSGRRPRLTRLDSERFDAYRVDLCMAGDSFSLDHKTIHRVTFNPCPHSGWFACLVREEYKVPAPSDVFSEYVLDEVPDADHLYIEKSQVEANRIVRDLLDTLS